MNIIVTARMGPGTFGAKFYPISEIASIDKIIVVRKENGPKINKIHYVLLPKICKYPVFNLLITPFVLFNSAKKYKAKLILAYYFKPHFFFAFLLSKFTGLPYIIGQTGTTVQNLADKQILGFPIRIITRNAFAFNVPGLNTKEFWLNKKVEAKNINILHSTINTEKFVPVESDKKYDFIFVGRLAQVKRLDKLIKAARKLKTYCPELKICIVGDGPFKTEWKKLAEQNEVTNVFDFVGFHTNTHEWLTKSHAFVMTSDSEGLPCAMMEAMSTGLVCLGPLVNNMTDLLKNGKTGFTFDTNNVEELIEKMLYIIRNRSSLEHIGIAARKLIIEEHSYQYAKDGWAKLLDSIPKF